MTYRNETVGRIVARAWSDPEFSRRLLADPHTTLAELGIAIPANKSVVAVENNPGLTWLVLPSLRYTETKSDYADIKAFGESYRDPRLSPLEWASRDPVFTERLKADPKAALRDMGMEVAEAMSVEIVQNTLTQAYLVLPVRPEETELTPDVLKRVCDGWIPPALRYAAIETPDRVPPAPFHGTGVGLEMDTIVYGNVAGAPLLADIARPNDGARLPVVLSIHGGRWYFGTRKDTGAIDVRQWAGFGFFAMSIDYRLVTCTPAPAPYQDVLCAIRWVHANARKYGLDCDRIFLLGMSAGGHMASLAATLGGGTFPRTGGWDEYPSTFRAAICVSGAYDLVSLDWGAGWAPPGVPFPDAREYASPLRHVAPGNVPQLILHSDDDPSIPIEQVLRMASALETAGAPYRFVRYTDRGHMFITDEVIEHSRRFIAEWCA